MHIVSDKTSAVKLIKCRIWRNDYFKIWCNCKRVQPLFCQTNRSVSVSRCWTTSARLFWYSYWVLTNYILNPANWIFADLRHERGRKSRRIWDIKKASHTLLAHHLLIDNAQSVWLSAVTYFLKYFVPNFVKFVRVVLGKWTYFRESSFASIAIFWRTTVRMRCIDWVLSVTKKILRVAGFFASIPL